MKAKRLSKAQRVDIITTLPQPIIETILCFLPIKEAATTSILSREWRYKWTTIPKLEFYRYGALIRTNLPDLEQTSHIERGRQNMGMSCKVFYAIHQVLLLRQGPIHEFTLSMKVDDTCFELDQIILHLSRNHPVKKLTLYLRGTYSYKLPASLFSLHHLTELNLDSCDLVHQPTFNGFGRLTSLSLYRVMISRESLLHLLSNCPSLKIFSLFMHDEDFCGDENPNIIELFECLPVIEHLTTWGYMSPLLVPDSVPQELPTLLTHLKYFCMKEIGFGDGYGLPFLCVLIKYSPNLEKIKLEVSRGEDYDLIEADKLKEYSVILEKYVDVWLEHLKELEINYFKNSKLEMEFVKFILVRSPNLKKVILRLFRVEKNEELKMLNALLHAPHASPVELVVENPINRLDDDDDDDDGDVDGDGDDDDDDDDEEEDDDDDDEGEDDDEDDDEDNNDDDDDEDEGDDEDND